MEGIERLRRVTLFAELPDEDLELLAEHCHPRTIQAGELLFAQGDWGDAAYVIEAGDIEILTDIGGREDHLATRGAGEVFGEMALLRGEPRMASARARTDVDLLVIPQAAMAHLLSCSATAARILFEIILDRLADTEAHLRQRERMAQLGTLTAGVAHELNNPAAAVARAANQLSDAVHTYARFAAEAAATLDEPGREAILQRPQTPTDSPQELSALERADREQEIEGALADAGLDEPWLYSLDLAALGIRAADLDHIRDDVGGGDLPAALRAIGSARTVDMLLRTVLLGSHRLSVIVKALKSYSYLDQAPLQDIDVTVGIEDTLLILASTLEGIHVERDYAEDLRTIEAHGSELNQVWTNLLSNAIDAITERRSAGDARAGRITISVHNTDAGIAVEITDNGIGIPPEVTGRVFDSFFTTKAPGKGTGIGLDISRQIVTLGHGGDISVQSEPGHTTFRVELPAQPVDVGTTTTRSSLEVP